jgi:salicylate hydroxylase
MNPTLPDCLIYRWVVHRHHLHTGLAESARRHGADLIIDARVASIDHSSNPVKVTTEKGAKYMFDLLIGSDGLKSTVRKTLFPKVKPRAPTNNAAYRGIIPYEEVFAKVPEAKGLLGNAIDVWGSPDGYCITYPISAGKDLNLVLSHHRPDYVEDVQEVDMDELRDFYKDYDPIIKKVIDLVPHSLRWPLMVTGPLESWSSATKNVVLMGDAAHSMVNHMAQGAATSMEDGAFLGRVISEVVRGVITMPEAIAIYEKTRMPRVWIKQQASFTAGEIYMCSADDAEVRNAASVPEISSSLRNVTNRESPDAKYRSWNIWGYGI